MVSDWTTRSAYKNNIHQFYIFYILSILLKSDVTYTQLIEWNQEGALNIQEVYKVDMKTRLLYIDELEHTEFSMDCYICDQQYMVKSLHHVTRWTAHVWDQYSIV